MQLAANLRFPKLHELRAHEQVEVWQTICAGLQYVHDFRQWAGCAHGEGLSVVPLYSNKWQQQETNPY